MADLPLCVKIEEPDRKSSDALERDNWRHIGTLVTYKGVSPAWEKRKLHGRVSKAKPEDIIDLAKQIEWHGRLWRDPKISRETAWSETERCIREGGNITYRVDDKAFALFDNNRVMLIGVVPSARGYGLSKILMEHATEWCGEFWAGTYDDNDVANRLYTSLGMCVVKWQGVWHK